MTGAGLIVWHDHVSPDADQARAFYTTVLGWQTKSWEHGESTYEMISVAGREHGGFFTREDGPAHWLPYVRVEDADGTAWQVEEAGGRVQRPPTEIPGVGWFAVAADPAGAVFAVVQDEGASPPSQDAFAWEELYVPDTEAALAFYGRLFGWTTAPFNEGYTLLKRGEETVGGIQAQPEALGGPTWLAYLAASDIDAAAERASSHGARTILAPIDIENVGRVAVLTDPLGAAFGLYGSSDSTRKV